MVKHSDGVELSFLFHCPNLLFWAIFMVLLTHWPLLKFERGPSVGQKYHSKTQSMLINITMLPFVVELFSSVWILLEESLWYTDHPLLASISVEPFLICPPSWTSAHPWGYTGYPLCLWLWTLWFFEWVYTRMYTSMRNPWATLDWPPITLAMRRRHLGEALAGESPPIMMMMWWL